VFLIVQERTVPSINHDVPQNCAGGKCLVLIWRTAKLCRREQCLVLIWRTAKLCRREQCLVLIMTNCKIVQEGTVPSINMTYCKIVQEGTVPSINHDVLQNSWWNSYLTIKWLSGLSRLVAGLPPRRPGFDPGLVHVGFVVDKVALGQVFPRVIRISSVNFITPVLHYLEKWKKLIIFLFSFITVLHKKP
jgi:hypothetical protein